MTAVSLPRWTNNSSGAVVLRVAFALYAGGLRNGRGFPPTLPLRPCLRSSTRAPRRGVGLPCHGVASRSPEVLSRAAARAAVRADRPWAAAAHPSVTTLLWTGRDRTSPHPRRAGTRNATDCVDALLSQRSRASGMLGNRPQSSYAPPTARVDASPRARRRCRLGRKAALTGSLLPCNKRGAMRTRRDALAGAGAGRGAARDLALAGRGARRWASDDGASGRHSHAAVQRY